jgi:hypothetical protein
MCRRVSGVVQRVAEVADRLLDHWPLVRLSERGTLTLNTV